MNDQPLREPTLLILTAIADAPRVLAGLDAMFWARLTVSSLRAASGNGGAGPCSWWARRAS
ncbi:hypothetical protein [Streptomyces lavendulae]|uniref:hypothetical protein n=1 Tax=Streptomyces lavendulae TaxID=1914 RepID=UPI000B2316F3|nr:hypothetical protein [Streptomyces lavendulae]